VDEDGRFRKNLREILGGITVVVGGLFGVYQFHSQSITLENTAKLEQERLKHEEKVSIEQLEHQREQVRNEQIGKGFEQLGGDSLTKRIAGIILLESAMKYSDDDNKRVLDALCAFVRQQTRGGKASVGQKNGKKSKMSHIQGAPQNAPIRDDVQTALTVIGKRNNEDNIPDLNNSNLSKSDLSGANLKKARLSHVNLMEANLKDADLSNAELTGSNLRATDLLGADLSDAKLDSSILKDAKMGIDDNVEDDVDDDKKTNLERADLSSSDLSNANLRNAKMSGAILSGVTLRNANLSKADLTNSILEGADLRDADLEDADLTDADLTDADLRSAKGLSKDQLETACGNKGTKLPPKLRIKLKTCENEEDNSEDISRK
jgi:uncharacterized protein YjbI with pentapeptide repeats